MKLSISIIPTSENSLITLEHSNINGLVSEIKLNYETSQYVGEFEHGDTIAIISENEVKEATQNEAEIIENDTLTQSTETDNLTNA